MGSTAHVNFNTSKTERWETDARRCHINWAILDSGWEGGFCRVVESHPKVTLGRWAFAEFTDVYEMQTDFEAKLAAEFTKMIEQIIGKKA